MIKEKDEQALGDLIVLFEHESKKDYVSAVVKVMVERTLALLRKPTDFLEELPFEISSMELFNSFHHLDKEIRRSLRNNENHKTYELLVDYIDLLPKFTPGDDHDIIRKYILANMLVSSESLEGTLLMEEKVDVYTSSEAADILDVSDQTIRRWCDKGKYPDAYQTEGGHWRIPKKYFKVSLEQARKRKLFEQQLNEFNESKGEADESEWL